MTEVDVKSQSAVNGSSKINDPKEDEELYDDSPSDFKENGLINGSVSVKDRIKRRAKRPSKFLTSKDLHRTSSDSQIVAPPRSQKNCRRPRNGFGRGLPKKGGAGGKGTWGALGSELQEEDSTGAIDANDPNYDDDSLENGNVKLKVINLEKSAEELEKKITTIMLEYYDHGDTDEVLVSLQELGVKGHGDLVVTTCVEVAMDHKPSHREMTSVLLADLYWHLLCEPDYEKGYDYLLNNLKDLVLDTPDAPSILGNFIARSVADDCIPPKFLQGYKGKVDCDYAVLALSRAEGLLSMRHGLVRLDNVWGIGGGTRPVKYLVKKMVLLLEEYLSSSDVKEATACLQELEVPHFHHELVYEAVNMVIEKMDERTASMMCALLSSLCKSIIITPNQMNEGFFRIYEDMPQICLDVPAAYGILEKFVNHCKEAKILEDEMVKKMPLRGRKRFVSEGDGGRVKDHAYF